MLVVALTFGMLQLNRRTYQTLDSLPYRYLPLALLDHHTFRLDAYSNLDNPDYYSIVRDQSGAMISKKPVAPALVEIPFFVAFTRITGERPDWRHHVWLGKLTMSLMAALAAGLLFIALQAQPLCRRRWLAALGGLGAVVLTPLWFTAMDCWPHPMLAALNMACLVLLSKRKHYAAWWGIGLLQGIAIAVRPGAVVIAVVFLVASLLTQGNARQRIGRLGAFLLGSLAPLALLGWYNHHYFGSMWRTGFGNQAVGRIQWPWRGIIGMLFSPAKGLFLFSPLLLVGLGALAGPLRKTFQVRVAFAALLVQLLFWGSYRDWWGGWSYGPRYLSEVLPFAMFLTVLAVGYGADCIKKKVAFWFAIAALAGASLAAQLPGFFGWDGDYHRTFDKGWGPDVCHWVWDAPYEPWWRWQQMRLKAPSPEGD